MNESIAAFRKFNVNIPVILFSRKTEERCIHTISTTLLDTRLVPTVSSAAALQEAFRLALPP